ncbi:periplasmic heavy metal sensor [Loktanella sp. S4079]|uniref:periplasmic heavy metal sensor n=1 Tax=Loktanella sp. S4079 TaxID=579483 RepID=UPI0005FA6055|nr:periplasmic heavy metal sensor [Loktanella sp. S4079]KJZ19682.1 hypothetical protein TW80_01930 [Loktanella sp. S4079]
MADQQSKAGRTMRIVLVASLALNLAVAGLAIGAVTSGKLRDGPPRSFDLGLGPVARALSPEDRREVARALRRARPANDFDIRVQFSRLIGAVRADPFSVDTLRSLMAEQSQMSEQLRFNAQEVLIDHLASMTVQERNEFADRLVDELSRLRERGHHKSRD